MGDVLRLPAFSTDDYREEALIALDSYVAVNNRAAESDLSPMKGGGRRVVAIVLIAAGDSAGLGGSSVEVRITGLGTGYRYFGVPVGGGQLITGAGWPGSLVAYVFESGLLAGDDIIIEATIVGTGDTGTSFVSVHFYFA